MRIRKIAQEDSSAFLELNLKLDTETKFISFGGGERTTTLDQMESRIQNTLQSTNEVVLCWKKKDKLLVMQWLSVKV